MHIRCLLSLLLLISFISCSEWRGLKVITVNKNGMFLKDLQESLESALKWTEKAINIQDQIIEFPIRFIKNNVEGYRTEDKVDIVTIQTPNKMFSLSIDSNDFIDIYNAADIVLFINLMENCGKWPNALGGVYDFPGKYAQSIQKLGFIHFCYNDFDKRFKYFDLFRHEILHALGYGTIHPHRNGVEMTRRPEESYQWKYEDSSVGPDTGKRYFFNTVESVTNEVKKHFNCDEIVGVESDEEGKHLNEYIFFDELMTPFIRYEENFFSYISAEHLENIYRGDKQWYKVNRTFIAPEADAYKYGKGFGCTYLKKSCFEFLAERKGTKEEFPIPFCHDTVKCFTPSMIRLDCKQTKYQGEFADNGIRPKNVASESMYYDVYTRYCPIFRNYYNRENETLGGPC